MYFQPICTSACGLISTELRDADSTSLPDIISLRHVQRSHICYVTGVNSLDSTAMEQNCFINWPYLTLRVTETFIRFCDAQSRKGSEKAMYGHVKIHVMKKHYFCAAS